MLMYAFHRHPDVLVFDEHKSSKAFQDYRIRSNDEVRNLLGESRFPTVCFKPICDSHRIGDLLGAFPDCQIIWIYRDFGDVSNSTLRKFDAPTRAIRLICTNQTGGGWLAEGVSPTMSEVLQSIYRPSLSDFDLVSLVWWVRNQILIENGLLSHPGVTIVKYETLVSQPTVMLKWLFGRIGVEYKMCVTRNISTRSIRRNPVPEMDTSVQELCTAALTTLDDAFHAECPHSTLI